MYNSGRGRGYFNQGRGEWIPRGGGDGGGRGRGQFYQDREGWVHRGGYDGGGRGRGQFFQDREGWVHRGGYDGGGRGRGQFNQDRGGWIHRGGGDGGGRGRGQSKWITDENKSEIAARRAETAQVGSEATDDLLPAPLLSEDQQHLAHWVISKEGFEGFRTQKQTRDFVHSLLVNLSDHHSVDMSILLLDLASEKGRVRLREILNSKMAINAGGHRNYLSFQYVILPLIGVLTRGNVCQSSLVQEVKLIYTEVYHLRFEFLDSGVFPCMEALISKGSINDTSPAGSALRADQSLLQVASLQHAMLAIIRLVYQLLKCVSGAKTEMIDTVSQIETLTASCIRRAGSSDMARFLTENLERECQRLRSMVSTPASSVVISAAEMDEYSYPNSMMHWMSSYDPPGDLSETGPRHDNDHKSIKDISIVPTHEELTSERKSYLPSNDVAGAPHFLEPGWPRLLDTHFRLNREDMIDQLRKSVTAFLQAWRSVPSERRDTLLSRRELRQTLGQDVPVYAYGNVEFLGTNTLRHLQGSIRISFDQPSMLKDQSGGQREVFWRRSKRRLMKGSLVCFIFPVKEYGEDDDDNTDFPNLGAEPKAQRFHLCLGVVSFRNEREMGRDPDKAIIHVSLTDPLDFDRFLGISKASGAGSQGCLMVQSIGGFFEAYRPILQALQTCEPGVMPFGKYLAPTLEQQAEAASTIIDAPLYTKAPDFKFDLSVLLSPPATCELDVHDPISCKEAVEALQAHSMLDDTQAQALVDALGREVALISGPPGTGKTKIGVDLMRVLLHNARRMKAGPILCICFTNHALDQFLEHLLDQGITRMVRIGGRSQSERLQKYNLYDLTQSAWKPFAVQKKLTQSYSEWDIAAQDLREVEKELLRPKPLFTDILKHVKMENDEHYTQLQHGDPKVGSKEEKKSIEQNYQWWISGTDLAQMDKENKKNKKKWDNLVKKAVKRRHKLLEAAKESTMSDLAVKNALADLDEAHEKPQYHDIPRSKRPLDTLLDVDIWTMSMQERLHLRDYWLAQAQGEVRARHSRLLDRFQRLSKAMTGAHDELRRMLLRNTQVIGMTTNGAAKFQSIMGALSPKIIICEEAGEVLESHILAALSGSTQHLILIGDHLQLRPQIATYALSSDSEQGRQYNLDRSLFERLVASVNIPSSLLTTQRRMRPEICDLIRHTLYPQLIDGERVLTYPDVTGMAENLFFMDHRHPEDSRDQYGIQSYANTFEVEMVYGLVQHLIKNGYQHSNIAVITPYLGQLSRLRDKLADVFRLSIDQRDQEQLEALTDDKPATAARWQPPSDRVLTLRTIDNFQGEEADIIIVSLVRSNTREDSFTASSTIGFLKSPNRTNVLLSRARHGMYLIGNAPLMDQAKNGIWQHVVGELDAFNRIGDGFPLRCRNHPDKEILACIPEDFKTYAPNGGCTQLCAKDLKCGHICKMMCHWGDREHLQYNCDEPCPRRHPICNHVCRKLCGQECGNCVQPAGALDLPCGHTLKSAFCFQRNEPDKVRCKARVVRKLTHCEHDHPMDCYKDPETFKCRRKCGLKLECGHDCSKQCYECQASSLKAAGLDDTPPFGKIVKRTVHAGCQQTCGKLLHCGHSCDAHCHIGANCPPCKKNCAFACSHAKCRHPCRDLCNICEEPCTWSCSHQGACPMPCGAPCTRLPCNRRCEKKLSCEHQCPSVCGEKCPPARYCVQCRSDASTMEQIVDPETKAHLRTINVSREPIIVLGCGHALTVGSLDRHLALSDYYLRAGGPKYAATKSLPNHEIPMAACPLCGVVMTGVQRYGRRIKFSQLVMRFKKFEALQNASILEAEAKLAYAQDAMKRGMPAFLDKIAKLKAASNWPTPAKKRSSSTRGLGHVEVEGTLFPNSDVSSLFRSYDILPRQERAWKELISPALNALELFDEIRKTIATSPTYRLYKASVSRLLQAKGIKVDLQLSGIHSKHHPREVQLLMNACAYECLLSPDGQPGSSYVRAIEGRCNVLRLILHAALRVLEQHTEGAESGWHWFIDDLLRCCLLHNRILSDAAVQGIYPKIEMCTKLGLLDVFYRRVQWLGYRPLDTSGDGKEAVNKRLARKALVHETVEPFLIIHTSLTNTHFASKETDSQAFQLACTERARDIEALMLDACRAAMGELDTPIVEQETPEAFRVLPTEISATDNWYRCPNGHPYMVRYETKGEPICSECDMYFAPTAGFCSITKDVVLTRRGREE